MIVWSTAEYVARNAVQPCEPFYEKGLTVKANVVALPNDTIS